ncbi:hypothetical protein [Roseimaritima sediminicola]|uniref:hypothetical protein n=1 Tax=Roseimaritima sediminicola TaxID=2662066 RepID=UPI0012983FF6|nr:hypothetical protein [Roseimaritima sediminicola]
MTDTRSTIRSMWAQLGLQARPAEVVEALERLGIEVSEEFVARVRSQLHRDAAKAARERAKRPPQSKTAKRPQQRKIPHRK